ncbi:MAG: hypothetical protein M1540_05440 [Candidatus Bathyarchaeota archaeon]|nr:hypothetical protein [Candidatus Bathyarchaeota archaeon]
MPTAPANLNCLRKSPQPACNVPQTQATKPTPQLSLLEEDEIRGVQGNF